MIHKLRVIARSPLRWTARQVGRQIMLSPTALRVFNEIYERGSDSFQDLFVRAACVTNHPPPRCFEWQVRLQNGHTFSVPVRAGDLRGWEFALAYQWADRSLRSTESELLNRLPLTGRLFDVGANMGLRSLYALSQGRPVTMFEPNAELRGFTEELMVLNGTRDWVLENVCVGAERGSVRFYISSSSYLSSLDRDHAGQEGGVRVVDVPMTTIDDYVAEAPDQRSFAVMKVDVEGAEIEVLKGAQRSIDSFRPALLIESFPRHLQELDRTLGAREYQGFGIVEKARKLLVPVMHSQIAELPTINFLYLPQERRELVREMLEIVR